MSNLRSQIKTLTDDLANARGAYHAKNEELKIVNNRIKEIAAENESLRQDKKWLQQMHSAVLQSMHGFVTKGRS